jgi:DtxR family Mn-dependent transcriptional regulator
MHSYTEENYIKAIYKLSAGTDSAVTTNALAEAMATRPASVSDMMKKLAAKNIIDYVKYQGVSLTPVGLQVALALVRRHRLWEVFLVQQLKFKWDEVHEVAEELEHVKSELLIKRLDEFLGFPEIDPHGDPIPAEDGSIQQQPTELLSELEVEQSAIVRAVKNTQPLFLQYLDKLGIRIGSKIKVTDKVAYDNSLEIMIDNRTSRFIPPSAAASIIISR